MRLFKYLCLFLILLFAVVVYAEEAEDSNETVNTEDTDAEESEPSYEEEDGVIVLTEQNFKDVALSKDIILVEFYAPWCGHCKRLEPEYAKAAKRMKESDPPVPFAKVDATENENLAQNYGVTGYPTLKIFRKGEAFSYDGPRDEEGIVEYMKEKSDPNWKPPPSAVVTLTELNFEEVIDETPLILVEFYAPWCGHCKKLEPEYEGAAAILQKEDPPIILAKVDATEEKDLASKYGVSGYPTLKMFRYGNEYEYKGPREKLGIVEYMMKQAGDSSELLDDMKKIKDFLNYQDDVSIVGFFESEEDPLYKVYMEAGNSLREDYRFSHTFLAEAREAYKISPNSVVIFIPKRFQSKYEPKLYIYSEDEPTEDSLTSFYDEHEIPLVGELTKDNEEKRYFSRPLLVAYYGVDWSFNYRKDTEFWRQKIVEIAKDNRDIVFAIADEDKFAHQLRDLELDDSGAELNIGLFDNKKRRFKMEPDDFDSDAVREFIQGWRDDELEPVIRSQPTPKKNNGPVKIVTGKTFKKIVLDDSKDVLIEIYAPWCGHCKKLEPELKKLGKNFKSNENIVIAKIDGTANDIPNPYTHSGFPTLYFAKAGDKENPIQFEGGKRDVDSLTEFIEENTSFSSSSEKDEL